MPKIFVKPGAAADGTPFKVRNPVTGILIPPEGAWVEHNRTVKRHLVDKPPGLVVAEPPKAAQTSSDPVDSKKKSTPSGEK